MFAYCLNNPVMYEDPSGRDSSAFVINIIKYISGLLVLSKTTCKPSDYMVIYNETSSGDEFYYIAIVIYNGDTKGKKVDEIDDERISGPGAFQVCPAMTSKKLCRIIGKHYTWIEDIDTAQQASEEIYAHAMMYYYSENMMSIIDEMPNNTGTELEYILSSMVAEHCEIINLGGNRPIDKFGKEHIYPYIWSNL